MACTDSECQRAIVANILFFTELFEHYARVLPDEERHRFAKLLSRGITKVSDEPELDKEKAIDILVRNGVELIVRSNTKVIKFEPRYAS